MRRTRAKSEEGRKIKRVCHKSWSFKEARDWDVQQQVSMTHEERQEAVKELKKRVYGEIVPDVRDHHWQK